MGGIRAPIAGNATRGGDSYGEGEGGAERLVNDSELNNIYNHTAGHGHGHGHGQSYLDMYMDMYRAKGDLGTQLEEAANDQHHEAVQHSSSNDMLRRLKLHKHKHHEQRHDLSKITTLSWRGHLNDTERIAGQDYKYEKALEHGDGKRHDLATQHAESSGGKNHRHHHHHHHHHHAEEPTESWNRAHEKAGFLQEITSRNWKIGLHGGGGEEQFDRRMRRGSLFGKTVEMKGVLRELEDIKAFGEEGHYFDDDEDEAENDDDCNLRSGGEVDVAFKAELELGGVEKEEDLLRYYLNE